MLLCVACVGLWNGCTGWRTENDGSAGGFDESSERCCSCIEALEKITINNPRRCWVCSPGFGDVVEIIIDELLKFG